MPSALQSMKEGHLRMRELYDGVTNIFLSFLAELPILVHGTMFCMP